jgi:hypothetical protein
VPAEHRSFVGSTSAILASYRRTSLAARLATALVVAYLIMVLISAAPIGNIHTGDTDLLVRGSRVLKHCLAQGHLENCGHSSGGVAIGPYALLQYLPAMAFLQFGLSNDQTIRALSALSFVAFVLSLILVLIASARLRSRAWAPILVLCLLGSSFTYQSTSGFGEALAACTVLAAVTATMWRRPWLILLTMTLATVGKETFAPFLLVLGLLAGRSDDDRVLPPRRVLTPLLVGIALGVLLNFGLNVVRFGTYRNVSYLEPILRTPGLGRKLNYLGAVWAAPSNGILWYWSLAAIVILLCGAALTVSCIRRQFRLSQYIPGIAAILILLLFTASLADWYTPFGWIAYGPRLAVPLLSGALVVIVYTCELYVNPWLQRALAHPAATGIAMGGTLAVGYAQFGAPWSYYGSIQRLITPAQGCPALTGLVIQRDSTQYYNCAHQVMWRFFPNLVWQAMVGGGDVANAARATLSVATLLLFLLFVSRVRSGGPRRKYRRTGYRPLVTPDHLSFRNP